MNSIHLEPNQRFVADSAGLDEARRGAKLRPCPSCGATGNLIGHGFLRGYTETGSTRTIRGRRFFCSNRFRKTGCGHTFSVLLSSVLARCIARTATLARMLATVAAGSTLKAAWERASPKGLTLRSGYRLWQRLLRSQTHIRTVLSRHGPPPTSDSPLPLAQLFAHIAASVAGPNCILAGFQNRFQVHLLAGRGS